MIAKIAVSAARFSIDKPYSYRFGDDMRLCPGIRVMVPFGSGNRRTEGVVLNDDLDRCVAEILDIIDYEIKK